MLLRELYQEMLIDHGRHPRNFGKLFTANREQEGYNPLCGDQLTLYLYIEAETVLDVKFEGHGCAIAMASASLMTEAIKNKKIHECIKIFNYFHGMLHGEKKENAENILGKLTIFSGVTEFPVRVKCATLAWHTLKAALENTCLGSISTEKGEPA